MAVIERIATCEQLGCDGIAAYRLIPDGNNPVRVICEQCAGRFWADEKTALDARTMPLEKRR